MSEITHWINGKSFDDSAKRHGEIFNPATGEVSKKVAFGTSATVDVAVKAATDAFAEWRHSSLTKRVNVLFAFRELVNANKEKIAALITAEHGKVLSDAAGEVTRGLEVVEFACGIPHLLKGGFSEEVSTGVDVYSIRQALGGAKNHMVVLPDADLDLAADAAINAGFGSAGERCMAISALVVVEPVADELVAKIKERAVKLKTGDGTKGADMGPLVTQVHRDKVASYVDAGEKEGATIVVDGRTVNPGGNGFWLGPTLFDHVTPKMSIYTDEIFGPVLSVIRVKSYDEALALVNSHQYGNGTAIFTNDGGAARRYQNEVEVGMVGINVPIPVPMAYYSFGGWKNSLFGDSHAHGTEGVHFFTRGKVVTSRWLDPSHGGINLGFPQNT